MAKFIVWQLKRWLIPALVIIGVISMSLIILSSTQPVTYMVYDGTPIYMPSQLFMSIMLFATIIATVFPMFVFNYKFGIRRADFYKQLPFEENQLKRIILVMGLVLVLIGAVLAFSLGFGIYFLRYYLTDVSKLEENTYLLKIDWKYVFYFFGVLLLATFSTYSISALFVYHNVSIFEAIVSIVLAHIFLGAFLSGILAQVYASMTAYGGFEDNTKQIYLSFSLITPIIAAADFDELFMSAKDHLSYNLYWNLPIYFALGIGSFLWIFFSKDRSADKENEKGHPSILTLIAEHGGFLSIILLFNYISYYLIYIAFIIMFFAFATYFFINVLYRHGFKLRMEQWIPMIGVGMISILDAIYMAIVANKMLQNSVY